MNCTCGMYDCKICSERRNKFGTDRNQHLLKTYTYFSHDFSTSAECNNCGQFGDNVTSHCPNFDITVKQMSKIQQGKLEYFKGKWWTANEA